MADGHELAQALRDLTALLREQNALVQALLVDSESARAVAALSRWAEGET